MSLREEAHQTLLVLALALARDAAAFAFSYASARVPWNIPDDMPPASHGAHKARPRFVCCTTHGEECRPSGPVVDCRLADSLRLGSEPSYPAFTCGVDLGMAAQVGPAWFVREWLPGLRVVSALH